MESPSRSQALMGNQNAAGKHIRRVGAAIKSKLAPVKPSNLRKGVGTTAGWVRDSAVLGAAGGAYTSHKLAKALGMKTAKSAMTKVAVRGALTGARAAGPLGLAVGAGVTGYGMYKDHQAKKNSIKGRAIAARDKIVATAKKAVKKIKG